MSHTSRGPAFARLRKRGSLNMKHAGLVFFIVFILIAFLHQNCAKKESSEQDQFSQSVTALCEPLGTRCLGFKVSTFDYTNYQPGYNRVSLNGQPAVDGQATDVVWSSNCVGSGSVLADCVTGETVTGTFSQLSSGRKVTVTFPNNGKVLQYHSPDYDPTQGP